MIQGSVAVSSSRVHH